MRVFFCTRAYGGWRTLLQPGVSHFEFFDDAHHLTLKLDAAAVLDFMAVQIRTARWVAAISAEPMNALAMERLELEIGEPPVLMPPAIVPKPLAPAPSRTETRRESRRARRRSG